jgi:hypothetical protein
MSVSQIRIKFFSSFCTSENAKEVYERMCETHMMKNYGPDKELYITTDDDYTHVIIMNTAMPELKPNFPKSNVIGLAFEPPEYLGITKEFFDYAIQNIGKYRIGSNAHLPPDFFVEKQAFMWHITPPTSVPQKSKIISIVLSDKKNVMGQQYRHKLVEQFIKYNLPIDIYGKGASQYQSIVDQIAESNIGPCIKGEFTELEPYNDYYFSICCENIQHNDYFSEKVINPLLCSSTPIYYGCKNIDTYFPDNIISLTGYAEIDILMVIDILDDPMKFYKKIDLDTVKFSVNLLKNIDTLFT